MGWNRFPGSALHPMSPPEVADSEHPVWGFVSGKVNLDVPEAGARQQEPEPSIHVCCLPAAFEVEAAPSGPLQDQCGLRLTSVS